MRATDHQLSQSMAVNRSPYLSHCASACKKGGFTVKHDNDIDVQEDVEVELRRELERLEVGIGSTSGGREGRPHITIQPTSSNNIHRYYQ